MANYPAPRDIPAGKILITEGPSGDQASIREVIKSAYCEHVAIRAKVRLVWSSPGFEPAGSVARWTNGFWAVLWEDRSGSTQGRRYEATDEGEAEARAHYDRLFAN
jgi:hypothetical protein